jgi:hypothetical protein
VGIYRQWNQPGGSTDSRFRACFNIATPKSSELEKKKPSRTNGFAANIRTAQNLTLPKFQSDHYVHIPRLQTQPFDFAHIDHFVGVFP